MTQALHALLSDAGIAVPPGLVNPGLEAITTDSRRVGPLEPCFSVSPANGWMEAPSGPKPLRPVLPLL